MKITNVSINVRSTPNLRDYNSDRAEFMKPARVYVWPSKENLLENLENRRSRPWKAWKELVTAELREAGYTGKVSWNQKAGCTCPCSPGFVLESALHFDDDYRPFDVHITVE